MIAKVKAFLRAAPAFLLAELADPSVKRGAAVALGALALKRGMEKQHASIFADATLAAVMVALSRAQGKAPPNGP